MLAAGKSSLVSHLQSHGRAASSLMIGSVRTLFVPYGAGSRRRINQNTFAATRKRSGSKPKIDITSAMPLSPQGKIFLRLLSLRGYEEGISLRGCHDVFSVSSQEEAWRCSLFRFPPGFISLSHLKYSKSLLP
jgi:hypothetical protein